MLRHVASVLVILTLAVPAHAAETLREAVKEAAVEAAAEEAEAVQQGQARQRSMARTWGGVGLILAGLVVPVGVKREAFGQSRTEYHPGGVVVAVGLVGAGVMLATVWADVPANPSIDFAVTPDRVQVGKTFSF